MDIAKAIELLNQHIHDPGSVNPLDLLQAQRLGIEALKLYPALSACPSCHQPRLLPGETKD